MVVNKQGGTARAASGGASETMDSIINCILFLLQSGLHKDKYLKKVTSIPA